MVAHQRRLLTDMLAIAKEVSATRIDRTGLFQGDRVPLSGPGDFKIDKRPGESGAYGNRVCVMLRGTFPMRSSAHAEPGDGKGDGRPGGGGPGEQEPQHLPQPVGRVRQSRRLQRSTTYMGIELGFALMQAKQCWLWESPSASTSGPIAKGLLPR